MSWASRALCEHPSPAGRKTRPRFKQRQISLVTTVSAMEEDPWSFSLREGGFALDDSDSDDSSALHVAQELRQSAHDDDVPFKENPWSIAKVNAASRRPKNSPKRLQEYYPSQRTPSLSIQSARPDQSFGPTSKESSDQDTSGPSTRVEKAHKSSMLMPNSSPEHTSIKDTCPTLAQTREYPIEADLQLNTPNLLSPFSICHRPQDSSPALLTSRPLCTGLFVPSPRLSPATPSLSYPSSPTLCSPASPVNLSKSLHSLSDDAPGKHQRVRIVV